MREIGGYIELDRYTLPKLHKDALALNCGRNAFAYLLRAREIKKIIIPRFLCGSVREVCAREGVAYEYYSIDTGFLPETVDIPEDTWLYLVNYYGQLSNKVILKLKEQHQRIIVDNAQAYFQMPVAGVDTLYTCRKFFGVADGAFLYTDAQLNEDVPQDESFRRMGFLLGRFERTGSEFYQDYVKNNEFFTNEPIKRMSKLTDNLLRGIDYDTARKRRTENFITLHFTFRDINRLKLTVPEGAFMYPLYIESGAAVRKRLQEKKIYIPTLWPDVFGCCGPEELEYNLANNILPLPIDQRYGEEDMNHIIQEIMRLINM